MADLKISVDFTELTGLIRTTDQTRQTLRVLGQQFARTNDQSAYLRAVNQVVKAQRMLGVESRMSRSEIMQLGAQYRQQTLFADELSRAQLQMAQATQQATNSVRRLNTVAGAMRQGMSRSSVAIQQTGYQVGDFLVQVQSGTNAFVAFGQQATQMAGLLTLSMNPAMVALGAALSILIPLSTAAAAMFVRSRNAGQEAADAFEEVANALRAMNSATEAATSPMSDLAERFGENTEQARQFLSVLRAVEQIRFQGAFSEAAQALRDAFDFGDFGAESLAALQDAGRAQETLLQSLLQRQRNLLQEGNNQAALALETQINELRSQYERAFGAMARDVESLASRLSITNEQANEFATILARIQEAQTFEQRGEAALALADYIRQNVEITENLSEAEQDAVENAVQLALQFLEASENAGRAADEGERLSTALGVAAAADLTGLNSQVAFLMQRLGLAADEAVRLNNALPGAGGSVSGSGLSFGMGGVDTSAYGDFGNRRLGFGNLSDDRRNVDRTGAVDVPLPGTGGSRGGGGGGAGRFQSDVEGIRELQAAIEAAADESRRFEQEISLLDTALEEGIINQQRYNELVAAAENAYGRAQSGAYDYEKALESLDDTFASSLEDTFMSIIDGSKSAGEAFRDMARQMIAEAMRMLVIRPLIQSLFGRFAGGGPFAAIGGALGGKFESGGNMRPGVPYLVGERGPELVIPGRSATVTNANLTEQAMGGNGGTVVVNQTINVSTGVQQTVRNEIKQLMPQIAESAKSAVVDAKRRGGSYGRAFNG